MDIQTQGIILSYKDYREVDRIVTLYTKDLGKLNVVARGVRKIQAKLAGHLELFNFTELQMVLKRKFLVISSINIDSFRAIKENKEKLSVAFAVSELLDKSVQEQQKDEQVFRLLIQVFSFLATSSKNFDLLYVWFAFRLIAHLGYEPELKKCVECHGTLNPHLLFFSISQGGALCGNCIQRAQEKSEKIMKINSGTLKVIRLFFDGAELINKLKIDDLARKELKTIIDRYLQFNVGVRVNSLNSHDS